MFSAKRAHLNYKSSYIYPIEHISVSGEAVCLRASCRRIEAIRRCGKGLVSRIQEFINHV